MNNKTKKEKEIKKKKQKIKIKQDKQKYFDFYDDVKHFSKGKEDW